MTSPAADRGILYLVPTPIGNLEDMSFRAVEVLKTADLVAAEDTRRSRRLLDHFGVGTPLRSYHDFSSAGARRGIVSRLEAGERVALISDAGTPGISDPAYRQVNDAIEAGAQVVPLPGATSIVPALVGSGLPCDRFRFAGFVPRKKGRAGALAELVRSAETVVFLESPHRLPGTLASLAELAPSRRLCLARELSKLHEEFIRGSTVEILGRFAEREPRGEFVLVLEGTAAEKKRLRRGK